MTKIAATAIVESGAELADDVIVGPGAIIEGGAKLARLRDWRNSIIYRGTRLGRKNRIFPFCSIGSEPQDKKYCGEESTLVMGNGNTVREYCFLTRGT